MIGQVPQEGLQRQISPHFLASPSGSQQALMHEKNMFENITRVTYQPNFSHEEKAHAQVINGVTPL